MINSEKGEKIFENIECKLTVKEIKDRGIVNEYYIKHDLQKGGLGIQ